MIEPITAGEMQYGFEEMRSKIGRHAYNPNWIIKRFAAAEGFMVSDMTGPKRDRKTARARQDLMVLLRRDTVLSLPAIGRVLGGRDHSTVWYGIKRSEERAKQKERTEMINKIAFSQYDQDQLREAMMGAGGAASLSPETVHGYKLQSAKWVEYKTCFENHKELTIVDLATKLGQNVGAVSTNMWRFQKLGLVVSEAVMGINVWRLSEGAA